MDNLSPDVQELIEAARDILINARDRGEVHPLVEDIENHPEAEFPRDEHGTPWFADWFALQSAMKPFETEGAIDDDNLA